MSQQLINRSPDLAKLQNEGYEVSIDDGYLILGSIPYVNNKKEICFGKLISNLDILGDQTTKPRCHIAHFEGEAPCNKDGSEILQIQHQVGKQQLTSAVYSDRSFSNKPREGYADYYEKMSTYARIISAPAKSINPELTEKTFKVISNSAQDSAFRYIDTNSSRADIGMISAKLEPYKIGIIGLGGTGSYILDFIAKSPVREIHLYDGDEFLQHNAFRAPGAPSQTQLERKIKKTTYFKDIYSNMRTSIFDHPDFIEESTFSELVDLSFIFICIDSGDIKQPLFGFLNENSIPFIDVGIGLEVVNDSLIGMVRTTTNTRVKNDHTAKLIPTDGDHNQAYRKNIQISELNALNAAMAVMKWKKLVGFYQDLENEHHSIFSINVNQLVSEENDAA